MVEFYFGQLVEYVRKQSELPHPRLDELEGRAASSEDEPPPGERRRTPPAEIPLNFCREGCYWPCEHR